MIRASTNIQEKIVIHHSLLLKQEWLSRFFALDAGLWPGKGAERDEISQRLGWIDCFSEMREALTEWMATLQAIRKHYQQFVLIGMGGSSLSCEVLRRCFRHIETIKPFTVLDSTDPSLLLLVDSVLSKEDTLFIVSSKSGSTIEVEALMRYFRSKYPSENFVVITDPESPLATKAERESFQKAFINPPNIGGRFSVLSLFGLIPGVLMGIPVLELLRSAEMEKMNLQSMATQATPNHPYIDLGFFLFQCMQENRNQILLHASRKLFSLGLWIEQLVAESSGKKGMGLLPIRASVDEKFHKSFPEYPQIYIRMDDEPSFAKSPNSFELTLSSMLELGSVFYGWEFATALACSLAGINAFDQPNVQESKTATKEYLDGFKSRGPMTDSFHFTLSEYEHGNSDLRLQKTPFLSFERTLQDHFSRAQAGESITILAYTEALTANMNSLRMLQSVLQERYQVPVSVQYGPRYLHSTGQFHKGGPDVSVFLLLTEKKNRNVKIPGKEYGFEELQLAQALGDFEALTSKDRRILHIHTTRSIQDLIQSGVFSKE